MRRLPSPPSPPKPYSYARAIFGPLRLRIAIPALLVSVPLLFGALTHTLIDMQIAGQTSKAIIQELDQTRYQIMGMVVAVSVVALLIGFGMVYYMVRPLEKLRQSIELASQGDFTTRLRLGATSDEVGQMGRSFDKMIEALNDVFSTRNRLLFDNSLQAVAILGPDGTIRSMNGAAAQLFGVEDPAELAGENLLTELQTRPGNEPLANDLYEAIATGRPLAAKQHLLTNLQDDSRLVLVSAAALRNRQGEPDGVAATFQNMAGLREFHERMNRSDRLAAIGTLTMGLAHEIRNPLGSIKGLVQILVKKAAAGSDTERYGSVIIEEVNRLDKLLTELLQFSHPADLVWEEVDLRELLESAERAARLRVQDKLERELEPAKLDVEPEPAPEPGRPRRMPVLLPRERVHQALLNILLNAHEAAADGGGEVVVRATRAGGWCNIEVENTGSSIPEEDLDRIFQPFYTTKDQGTGLGLALTYQILTYLGGEIDAQSEENLVRFAVRLPEAPPAEAPAPAALASDPTSSQR